MIIAAGGTAGQAYAWESFGAVAGGALFSFVLIHLLNPFDYFRGGGTLAWWWGLSAFAGLWRGLLRERTGTILVPAIVHGFLNGASRAPDLLGAP